MRWLSRLKRLISGADSNTATRAEQSEYARTTVRSVEITIDTDEAIAYQRVAANFSAAPPAKRAQNQSDQAASEPFAVKPRTVGGETNDHSED